MRLRRSSPDVPGYARRRNGTGFVYLDQRGKRIGDPATVERIRALAIPPAWTDVWICPDERGHLQAVGIDAAGRRQYRYHDAWRERRDRDKFAHVEGFAERLPELRARVAADLRKRGFPRERVLACSVRLLDLGLFRVGTEDYTLANGSFGLATIRKDHTTVRRDRVEFDFVGKSGKRHVREVRDAAILPVLRSLRRRVNGGEELLAYKDGDAWRDIRSSDINAYVQEVLDEGYSAKDFRTWHATVLAAVHLGTEGVPVPASPAARRRSITAAVKEVAVHLGNTPAVCRRAYIDPRVTDRYLEGLTIDLEDVRPSAQAEIEAKVLELLRSRSDASLRAAA